MSFVILFHEAKLITWIYSFFKRVRLICIINSFRKFRTPNKFLFLHSIFKFQCKLLRSSINNRQPSHLRFISLKSYLANPLKTELRIPQCSSFLPGQIKAPSKHLISRKSSVLLILNLLTWVWFQGNHGSVSTKRAIWISTQIRSQSMRKFSERLKIIFKAMSQSKINKKEESHQQKWRIKTRTNGANSKFIPKVLKIMSITVKNTKFHSNHTKSTTIWLQTHKNRTLTTTKRIWEKDPPVPRTYLIWIHQKHRIGKNKYLKLTKNPKSSKKKGPRKEIKLPKRNRKNLFKRYFLI